VVTAEGEGNREERVTVGVAPGRTPDPASDDGIEARRARLFLVPWTRASPRTATTVDVSRRESRVHAEAIKTADP
jgi:hypothetical protein